MINEDIIQGIWGSICKDEISLQYISLTYGVVISYGIIKLSHYFRWWLIQHQAITCFMMAYCWLDTPEQTSVKFWSKISNFQSKKGSWKCCLQCGIRELVPKGYLTYPSMTIGARNSYE